MTSGARELGEALRDRELFLRFARIGETNAVAVSHLMSASNPDFWDLAFEILDMYPRSSKLRARLSYAAQRMGEVSVGFSGPAVALADIESQLQKTLSPVVRAWLEELAREVRAHLEQLRAFELERKINN